jgi:hypothetical protein
VWTRKERANLAMKVIEIISTSSSYFLLSHLIVY